MNFSLQVFFTPEDLRALQEALVARRARALLAELFWDGDTAEVAVELRGRPNPEARSYAAGATTLLSFSEPQLLRLLELVETVEQDRTTGDSATVCLKLAGDGDSAIDGAADVFH